MLLENEDLADERKWRVERPISFIKDGLKFRKFMLRGLEKVKGEWSLIAAVYNLMVIRKIIMERGIKI